MSFSAAIKLYLRFALGGDHHFNIARTNAFRKARAERFEDCLFGRESRGVMTFRARLLVAIGLLVLGEDARFEARSALENCSHTLDLDDIDADRMRAFQVDALIEIARDRFCCDTGVLGCIFPGCVFPISWLRFWIHHQNARYSTVTDFARLRGWSTSQPRLTATARASSCSGTLAVMGMKVSRTRGI